MRGCAKGLNTTELQLFNIMVQEYLAGDGWEDFNYEFLSEYLEEFSIDLDALEESWRALGIPMVIDTCQRYCKGTVTFTLKAKEAV